MASASKSGSPVRSAIENNSPYKARDGPRQRSLTTNAASDPIRHTAAEVPAASNPAAPFVPPSQRRRGGVEQQQHSRYHDHPALNPRLPKFANRLPVSILRLLAIYQRGESSSRDVTGGWPVPSSAGAGCPGRAASSDR